MKPREKFLKHGAQRLESWELVATILWSGISGKNVFQIAKKAAKLLEDKQDTLLLEDLIKVEGIWNIKAMQLISAFELAKRHYLRDDIRIESIGDILSEVREYRRKKQEYLVSLTLDGAGRLINKRVITIGLLDRSFAHPREIFSWAISDHASSFVLVHNHPSGNPNPSNADKMTTNRIWEVANLVGIKFLDHIIITDNSHYSFRENSLLF